jgi:hypothetical protein
MLLILEYIKSYHTIFYRITLFVVFKTVFHFANFKRLK